jgi:tetratricopeptide (TPR) repeat protein
MLNYYQILGVDENASQEEIKRSFKKLAVLFHPDKNPGNTEAEERFKEINAAYQVLSDPETKSQYDLRRAYGYESPRASTTYRRPPPYTSRRQDPYGNPFKTKPTTGGSKYYEVGWTYVKHQALAFGFIFVVAIVYLTVKGIIDYQNKLAYEALVSERDAYLDTARMEFRNGHYEATFNLLKMVAKTYPPTPDVYDFKMKAVKNLTQMADDSLEKKNYLWAVQGFDVVREHTGGINMELYQKIAQCYKGLGDYEKAARVLDYLLMRDFENLTLNLEIASIYRDVLKQPQKAEEYYERAKSKIKRQLKETYGDAYEIVMDPSYSPEIYYEVFYNAAVNSSILEDYDGMIKNGNWSVFFNPESAEGYFIRANGYHGVGKIKRACDNWKKATELGHPQY